jgi:hypothetical protein
MESQDSAAPTLIVLRYGDPLVDALRAAGSGRLVILRVLPQLSRTEPNESTAPLESAVRADLARLVAGRRPVPRLVVRFGDTVEQAVVVAAVVAPDRVVAARDLTRRLARALPHPVLGAEDALTGAPGLLRRALRRPADEKFAALRATALFEGVPQRDLRRLASLLDRAEVGPGHVLVREGRQNETLWLLLAGIAQSSIRGREVGRLRAPALVGVPSMVYNRPAIATITAVEPVKALVAGQAQFQAIGAIDAVALRLKAATADRLSDYLSVWDRTLPSGAPNGRRALA